jgi:formylmethanofuran dehydrogenase subunit B
MSDRPTTSIAESAACLACGCLCDDIRVEAREGRVVGAEHACPIGLAWFLAPRPGEGHPAATIEGQPATVEMALDRAAEILRGAKSPLVWGLSGSTIEAARSAVALADRLGAVVDVAGDPVDVARLAAFRRVGRVSASLGEIKDRADVVVFWGGDPDATHPRHRSRYSVEPRGRFLPEGRAARFVAVVGGDRERVGDADLFVPMEPEHQAEAVDFLRARGRDVAVEPARWALPAGTSAALGLLADRLLMARYGALFLGSEVVPAAVEPLARLVRDLNEGRRFVSLDLGSPGNRAGASSLLCWQAGAPSSVDFSSGVPRHLPGEATLAARLARGEVDLVLLVADDPSTHLDAAALDSLAKVATIRLAPGATGLSDRSTVAFDVARPGIESGGTVERVDGVMLPLRPAISVHLPTDRDLLEALIGRLRGS